MTIKQQFNIYLPADLIRKVKHRAIDAEKSLSVFIEDLLTAYLEQSEMTNQPATRPMHSQAATLTLMPIVYVSEMERALIFYQVLGCALRQKGSVWSELTLAGTTMALHQSPEKATGVQQVTLAMVSHEPLENVVARLRTASITLERDITDEAFGRSILVRDPDGLAIQINEHDQEV